MLFTQPLSTWFSNAAAIEAALLKRPDVPPALACAIIDMEGDGRNVYGNDTGGVFSTPGAPDKPVTHDNYHGEYLPLVLAGAVPNGVGPAQITWAGSKRADGTRDGGFHRIAKELGLDLSDPHDNTLFGLRLIDEYLTDAGGQLTQAAVESVGRRYNGNLSYGQRLWSEVLPVWVARLAPVVVTPPPAPVPAPVLGVEVDRAAMLRLVALVKATASRPAASWPR